MPEAPLRPADDTSWQTLVQGSPVHVILSCTLPRTDVPLFLALLRGWREGLGMAEAGSVMLCLHDPDHTITLNTVLQAVGPAVFVILTADPPHA